MNVVPFHSDAARPEVLLNRLDAVLKSGKGWRARCPACGGTSRKLSISVEGAKVLVHCFGCQDAQGVLDAVGLKWTDLMPPRNWPISPDERKKQNQAIREAGVASAIDVLSLESVVVQAAARQLQGWQPLSVEDDERLALACNRIGHASVVLTSKETFKPDYYHPPARLVAIKRGTVNELRRELAVAEKELESAEAALVMFKAKQAAKGVV